MLARVWIAYRLVSASKLDGISEGELASFAKPHLVAELTENPDEALDRIDRTKILGQQIMGFWSRDGERRTPDQIEAELARLRGERESSGVFLVFAGHTDIDVGQLRSRTSVDSVDVAFVDFDKKDILGEFAESEGLVLASLNIGRSDGADFYAQKVGHAVVVMDGDREIYPFRVTAGAMRGTAARALSQADLIRTKLVLGEVRKSKFLKRVSSLMAQAERPGVDPVAAFVGMWSALEIFTNTAFKSDYQRAWFGRINSAIPPASAAALARVEDVMSDKLRLSDKFAVIAAFIDPVCAENDVSTFARLKAVRDAYFHSPSDIRAELPMNDVRSLLEKYLRLHVLHALT